MRPTNALLRAGLYIVAFFAVLGTAVSQVTPSQVDPNNATGIMPYNTYGGVRENISLATGNLNLHVPLVTLPGRKNHDLSLGLVYDSKAWNLHYQSDEFTTFAWWDADQIGWRLDWPTLTGSTVSVLLNPNLGTVECDGNFIVQLPDGSKHPFSGTTPQLNVGARTNCWHTYPDHHMARETNWDILQFDTSDGSYLRIDVSNTADVVVYEKDGSQLHFGSWGGWAPATKIQDTDGNQITLAGGQITDTVGRNMTLPVLPTTTTISYKDSGGTSQAITLGYTTVTLNPAFVSPSEAGSGGQIKNLKMLTSVTLPNGRGYSFEYDNGGATFGELTKISYPTGGYSRYDYGRFQAIHQLIGDALIADFREVTARHVCRDANGACTPSTEDTTTYTPTVDSGKINNQYEDVVDPVGDHTRYEFSYIGQAGKFSPRELTRSIYDASGNLIRTIHTDYNALQSGDTTNASLPIRKTTTLNDTTPALTTKTEWDYDTIADNVTAEREYDYSTATPPLLRQTIRTWLHTNSVNGADYTAIPLHILNRALTENIKDASSNNVAQTAYEYDNYGTISPSGVVQHSSAYGTTYTRRANVTKSQRWRNTDGAWLTTTNTYDDAGNVLTRTAPSNSPYDSFTRTTTLSYADAWGNTSCTPTGGSAAAYVTAATNAASQVTHYTHNSCTGTMASLTDSNSQQTTFGYDLLARLTQTTYPDGGVTTNCFSDVSGASCFNTGQISLTRTDKITSSISESRKIVVDGIGNVTQTQLTSDPDGIVYTEFGYDGLGRKVSVSNPHRSTSSSTDGTTQYTYDPLNRVRLVLQPDGSVVSTSYVGNQTTVTDEVSKKRKSQIDGLGRLTAVWEDPNGLNYETDYQYNALGNLLRVDQKGGDPNSSNWRTRTYTYDSLSQLLCAANPEIAVVTCPNPDTGGYTAGTLRYAYDNEGNLVTKTSPKPNQTGSATVISTNSYDALNRLIQKSYNDGSTPTMKYGYDGLALTGCTTAPPALTDTNPVGRRTAMCDASGATSWKHDEMGRTLQEKRKIGTAAAKSVTYTLNLDGSVATLTYPSGNKVNYSVNAAGRTVSAIDKNGTVSDTTDDINYVTGATYAPQGSLSSFAHGSSISGAMTYNSRLQPLQLYFTTGAISPTTSSQLQQATCPTTVAAIMSRSYNFGLGTNDNGNVISIANCRDTNRTQNFDYDNLNRIQHAYTSGNNWGEAFTIDAWGNLTNKARYLNKAQFELLNVAPANAKNQLTGFGYDAAGNMISNGGATYTYDAENRLITASGVTYTYDGDSNRVKKSSGTLYWGAGPLAESDLTASPTSWKDYVFFNGKRVGRRDASNGGVHYFISDHLGSTSVVTNSTGATLEQDIDYYPYGVAASGSASDHYMFTGNEKDAESGLDHVGQRLYSAPISRFSSPDPIWVVSSRLVDPQGLNLYSYTRNRPLIAVDSGGDMTIVVVVSGARPTGPTATVLLYSDAGDLVSTYTGLARGQHTDRFKTYGDTPYGKYNIKAVEGGKSSSRLGSSYGTGKIKLQEIDNEGDRTLLAIHGGGKSKAVPDPYDPQQKLIGTGGCVRLSNEDVNSLIGDIDELSAQGDDPIGDSVFIGDRQTIKSLNKGAVPNWWDSFEEFLKSTGGVYQRCFMGSCYNFTLDMDPYVQAPRI